MTIVVDVGRGGVHGPAPGGVIEPRGRGVGQGVHGGGSHAERGGSGERAERGELHGEPPVFARPEPTRREPSRRGSSATGRTMREFREGT
jgi:hypothetical protein